MSEGRRFNNHTILFLVVPRQFWTTTHEVVKQFVRRLDMTAMFERTRTRVASSVRRRFGYVYCF